MVSAVMVGVLSWHSTLAMLTNWGRRLLNDRTFRVLSVVAGLVLMVFALRFLYDASQVQQHRLLGGHRDDCHGEIGGVRRPCGGLWRAILDHVCPGGGGRQGRRCLYIGLGDNSRCGLGGCVPVSESPPGHAARCQDGEQANKQEGNARGECRQRGQPPW